MERRRYKTKTGFSAVNRTDRNIIPFKSTLRGTANPRKTLKKIRIFSAMQRRPLRVVIFLCIAVAVTLTIVFLSVNGNAGKNNAPQTAVADEKSSDYSFVSDATKASSALSGPSPSPTSTTEPAEDDPLNGTVFEEGMSDPLVVLIQQRLMDLNYMDDATPTELYGPLTQQAVRSFQRQAKLPTDGCMGTQAYTVLMSESALEFAVSLGAQGADVEDMIYCLYELGYIDTAPDTFTEAVKTAVEEFQETNGLDVDGIIGEKTKEMIYSSDVKEYNYSSEEQSDSTSVSGNITQKTNLSPGMLEAVLPSALNGLGQAFYDGEQQYGINSLFVLSIINYESANGTSSLAQNQNNLGGISQSQGGYKTFSSKEECVLYMYDLLSTNYIGNGLTTIEAVGEAYCSGGTWATKIKENMQELIDQCGG